jgi:hypothetical protein
MLTAKPRADHDASGVANAGGMGPAEEPVRFWARAVSARRTEPPLLRSGGLTAYDAETLVADIQPLGAGAVLDLALSRPDAETLLLLERVRRGLERRGITVRLQRLAS